MILEYIKDVLQLDFDIIELSDEKLQRHIQKYTLLTFSTYVPDIQEFTIDTTSCQKYNGRSDQIYISLPSHLKDKQILNVVDVIHSSFNKAIFGHDLIGLTGYENLPNAMIRNIAQNTQYKNSVFNFVYDFKHPNILIMRPFEQDSKLYIKQEMTHNEDLSTIPQSYSEYFMNLCVQETKIMIGNLRSKYSNIQTPWLAGNLDTRFQQEGMQEKQEILQKLQQSDILTNIIIDHD